MVYRLFDQLKAEEVGPDWCDLIVRAVVRAAAVCPLRKDDPAKKLVQPLSVEWFLRRWNREALHEQQRMRKIFVRVRFCRDGTLVAEVTALKPFLLCSGAAP